MTPKEYRNKENTLNDILNGTVHDKKTKYPQS